LRPLTFVRILLLLGAVCALTLSGFPLPPAGNVRAALNAPSIVIADTWHNGIFQGPKFQVEVIYSSPYNDTCLITVDVGGLVFHKTVNLSAGISDFTFFNVDFTGIDSGPFVITATMEYHQPQSGVARDQLNAQYVSANAPQPPPTPLDPGTNPAPFIVIGIILAAALVVGIKAKNAKKPQAASHYETTPSGLRRPVQPPSPAGNVSCAKCGAPNAAGAKFCSKCGAAVSNPPEQKFCAGCGSPLAAGDKFCKKCGSKLP
jgi:hypothetical protein